MIARLLDEKLAKDIVILNVKKICNFTDYFVIASVESKPQLRAASMNVEVELKKEDERPFAVGGVMDSNWGVMDYGDVVVHIFMEETRSYYDLERLWGDAVQIDWKE